jgi:hypothetical protein
MNEAIKLGATLIQVQGNFAPLRGEFFSYTLRLNFIGLQKCAEKKVSSLLLDNQHHIG